MIKYILISFLFLTSCKSYYLGKYCKPIIHTIHDTTIVKIKEIIHDTTIKTITAASSSTIDLGNPCLELFSKLDSANDVYTGDMYSRDRTIVNLQNGIYSVKLEMKNGNLILTTKMDSVVQVNSKLQSFKDSIYSSKGKEAIVEQVRNLSWWQEFKVTDFFNGIFFIIFGSAVIMAFIIRNKIIKS